MSLDLNKVAEQIGAMVSDLVAGRREKQVRLEQAMGLLNSVDLNILKKKVANSRTTWLVAGIVDDISGSHPSPPTPEEFTVLATDGSHIDVDRHRNARCFLINIGTVLIKYGKNPEAILESYPRLYSNNNELVIKSPDPRERDKMIEGTLLNIKRSVEELSYLVRMGENLPEGITSLALLDGSLILWGLTDNSYPEFVHEELLQKGALEQLNRLKTLNENRSIPLASYISFPRSSDVVNILRIAVCPHDVVDTDIHCKTCKSHECEAFDVLQDRDIFGAMLRSGDRSALFSSTSSIMKRYGDHRIYFFYLNAGDEVARIEIPEWVAVDKKLLDICHALVVDQCRRGNGYPVVLSEAHEQAVVTASDREYFWELVEELMVKQRLPPAGSAKSQSKRTRWI